MRTTYNVEDALKFVLEGGDSEIDGVSSDESDDDLDVSLEPDTGKSVEELSTELEDDPSDDIIEPDIASATYTWRKKDIQPCDTTFVDGPVEPAPNEDETPFDYYKKFVQFDSVAEQTNLYSTQRDGSSMNITPQELEQFNAVYFRMGLVQMPSQRSYWESDMSYNGVSSIMPRNRFEKIIRSIHFIDNLSITEHDQKTDRIWKIRPWINQLRNAFATVSPEEHHAVDEIMIAFKGRSLLRQYMPMKPHKWGFKLWGRSGQSGFLYDFDVYQGRSQSSEKSVYGVSGDVVLQMTASLPKNRNFKVFADNFFTGLPFIEKLKSNGIFYVGTVRMPRMKGCPLTDDKELKKKGRGAVDYRLDTQRNIVAVRWFDNKSVNIVSSYVGVEPIDQVQRYDRSKRQHISIPRPNIIKIYNIYMGGIDKLDMMCAMYKPTLRSRKWYMYIFLHTLQIALVNAWLLYRRNTAILKPNAKLMPLHKFQSQVAQGLASTNKRIRGRPSLESLLTPIPMKIPKVQSIPTNDTRKDGLDHFPMYEAKRQRCMHCPKGVNSWSYFRCKKCNVWLCLNKDRNCFNAYHGL